MQLLRHRFSFIELMFCVTICTFFFSQYATGVPVLGSIFQAMERYKIKYILSFILAGMTLVGISKRKEFYYKREIALLFGNVFILVAVSVIYQVINGFHGDTFNEAMYFIVPAILVFALVNHERGNIKKYIDFMFYLSWICFFTQMFDVATSTRIASGRIMIDFIDSYSPFESGLAFFAVVFVFFYTFTGEKRKRNFSFILCVLSLKRMSFIFSILFILIGKRMANLKVNRLVCTAIFCLIPFAFYLVCNDNVALEFYRITGLNLNQFMMGRFDFINLLVDNSTQIKYGLGSCRAFLSHYYQIYYNTVGLVDVYDPHNDILRFFLECTILGSFSLAASHFFLTSGKTCSTILLLYIFIECCFNHLFGAGNTAYWVLVYLVVFYIDGHQMPDSMCNRKLSDLPIAPPFSQDLIKRDGCRSGGI